MPIDPETQAALVAINEQIAALRRDLMESPVEVSGRVSILEARIGRWALNGLQVLDTGNAFAGKGGAYGSSSQFKRSDA